MNSILQQLNDLYEHPIRDPLWGNVKVSTPMLAVINRQEFQQLSRIKQLGPSYLVYPGATHTRLNHSLGVFHLAYRMVQRLVPQDNQNIMSLEGVQAFLYAALLHDLGHFPYTHSLKELPLREHEELTAQLVITTPIADILRNQGHVDPQWVAQIVDQSLPCTNPEILLYRRFLSGPLDPDKLDYLNRDAYFCGIPYGAQDVDFVLSKLRLEPNSGLAMDLSGVSALEHLLFGKYLMYKAVYWHKTVRSATAMIKKALVGSIEAGVIEPQELYGLDDGEFFALCQGRNHPLLRPIPMVPRRELYLVALELRPQQWSHLEQRMALGHRNTIENALAQALQKSSGVAVDSGDIIIDIPESISFEVSMNLYDGQSLIPYIDSNSVFTPAVVSDFTNTLRHLRIFVHPKHNGLKKPQWYRDALIEAVSGQEDQ